MIVAAFLLQATLTMTATAPKEPLAPGEEAEIEIVLSVPAPWYIYAPTGVNEAQGMVETAVEMRNNDTAQYRPAVFPDPVPYGAHDVFLGDGITLRQPLRIRFSAEPGEAILRGDVFYQLCKPDLCLPPSSSNIRVRVNVER